MIPLPGQLKLGLVAAIALTAAVAAGSAAWWLRGTIAAADLSSAKLAHAVDLKAVSDKAAAAANKALQETKALKQKAAENDRMRTQERENAQNEIDRLRADLAARKLRLSVAATCPGSGHGMPGAAGGTGLDDAGAPQLTPAAEQDYLSLVANIRKGEIALSACQEHVRLIKKKR